MRDKRFPKLSWRVQLKQQVRFCDALHATAEPPVGIWECVDNESIKVAGNRQVQL